MIFLSSTRTSSLAILYLLVTRSIISSEFVRLFFDSFADFFLRNHGVLIFNRSTKPSAMASTAPRISKIPPSPKPRYLPIHPPFHFLPFVETELRSIFKSESPILNDLVEKWGRSWMQKITKEHRNLVFFFFFFLPNSISMEVDGREESRNVGIVREGVESNHRYRPSRVPTHSGPPSRHRKLHAADNFARRGRYIGVITIITLLAVFSP